MDQILELTDRLGLHFDNATIQALTSPDWHELAAGFCLIAVAMIFRKGITNAAIRLIVFVGNAIGVSVNETAQASILPAVQALVVSLVFYISLEIFGLPEPIAAVAEKILVSIALIAVFAAIYSLTDPLAVLLRPYRTARTQIQVDWFVGIAKGTVVVIGITGVLNVWGIDLGPALTGMGVFGAGVALAAQDLFKNLIAGVTNMSEKQFQVGDWIRVEGLIEGMVERVEFRSTLIKRFDLAPVHVPNADLANAMLTNFSRMPHRRIYWTTGVIYSTKTEQLISIKNSIDDFVPKNQASCFVHIDSFNASSIDRLVYCFTKSSTYSDYLRAKENLVLLIKETVEKSGTSFAYPSQSIYMEAPAGADGLAPGTQPIVTQFATANEQGNNNPG